MSTKEETKPNLIRPIYTPNPEFRQKSPYTTGRPADDASEDPEIRQAAALLIQLGQDYARWCYRPRGISLIKIGGNLDKSDAAELLGKFVGELVDLIDGECEDFDEETLKATVNTMTEDEVCWSYGILMDMRGSGSFLVSVDNFDDVLEDGRFTSAKEAIIALGGPKR